MGKVNLTVADSLETKFRQTATKKFGYKRGFLQKAVDEALKDWVVANADE